MKAIPWCLVPGVLLALAPAPARGNAVIRVKCASACRIKIDGKRGEKISDSEYRYDQIEAGLKEIEVSRGFTGGWADIPAEGEVEVVVTREKTTVNGVDALDNRAKRRLEKEREEAAEKAEKARKAAENRAGQADEKQQKDDRPKGAQKAKTRIAVMRLVARTGLEQSLADLYADALVGELRRRPGLVVTDRNDIAAALGAEKERALLGCAADTCVAEIGGALGVEQLIHGSVGRVGKSLIVNLTLVDARKAHAITTVSERLKSSSDEELFDALPKLVTLLLKPPRQ